MIYQLPSGKIIYISFEQFLELTDEDEQYLRSTNEGDYPSSIWQDSVIKKKSKKEKTIIETHDDSIDYVPDNDEIDPGYIHISIDELPHDIADPKDYTEDID